MANITKTGNIIGQDLDPSANRELPELYSKRADRAEYVSQNIF